MDSSNAGVDEAPHRQTKPSWAILSHVVSTNDSERKWGVG